VLFRSTLLLFCAVIMGTGASVYLVNEESGEPFPTVVIDVGSCWTKVGVAGGEPVMFPTLYGREKPTRRGGDEGYEYYVGDRIYEFEPGKLIIHYPIQFGVVLTDWKGLQEIWRHAFENVLQVDPANCTVLFTEASINSKNNRGILTDFLFSTFNVRAVHVNTRPVMSLLAAGLTTGIVVQSGDSVTFVVPVVNGSVVSNAIIRSDIGGANVTDYFNKLLYDHGNHVMLTRDAVNQMKEEFSFVTLDYAKHEYDFQTLNVTIGDNEYRAFVSDEHYSCAEILFKPELIGKTTHGIHQLIVESISKCHYSVQKALFANIVLAGGNSMLRGLDDRVAKEVRNLKSGETVNVTCVPNGKYSAFTGGSIFANASRSDEKYQSRWFTKEDYEAAGDLPASITQKCRS